MRLAPISKNLITICFAFNLTGKQAKPFDRLEPVPAYDTLGGYAQAVFNVLVKERLPELWMIAKPSFSCEYAVVLGRIWDDGTPRKVIRYELRWVQASRQIWHHKQIKGTNSYKIAPLKNPGIVEITVEFPREAAIEVSKAWSRTIRESRYPQNPILGCDGETYEFYSHYNLFGQTWSPESGAPAMMVELGESLISYVKSKPEQREKALHHCLEIARKLQIHTFE